jgi:hypothetical protein
MSFYLPDRELNPPEILENECLFCGNECEKEFCSNECKTAYLND